MPFAGQRASQYQFTDLFCRRALSVRCLLKRTKNLQKLQQFLIQFFEKKSSPYMQPLKILQEKHHYTLRSMAAMIYCPKQHVTVQQ